MQHWLESFSLELLKDQNLLCLWSLVLYCVTFSQLPKHHSQHTLGVDRITFNFSGSFRCFPLTFSFISQICHAFFSLDQRPGFCWLAKGPVITSHWGPRPEEEQHFGGQLLCLSMRKAELPLQREDGFIVGGGCCCFGVQHLLCWSHCTHCRCAGMGWGTISVKNHPWTEMV